MYDSANDLKFILYIGSGETWNLGGFDELRPHITKVIVDGKDIEPTSSIEFANLGKQGMNKRHYVIVKTDGFEKLPRKCFYNDSHIAALHIPACVKKISDYNGQNCYYLGDIYCYSSIAPKGALLPLLFYDLENSNYVNKCGSSCSSKRLHILKDATRYNKSPWNALIEKCGFQISYIE